MTLKYTLADDPNLDWLPFSIIYEDEKIKIFKACSTAWWVPFQNVSPYLTKNIYIFGEDYGPTTGIQIHHQNPKDFLQNMEYPENFCFLSNEENTHKARIENGFTSIHCNINTFINHNIFDIKPIKKKYNMVINSRIKDWKGFHLASEMENLALIASRWGIENQLGSNSDDYLKLNYTYLNHKKLSPDEVCNIYNESNVGGKFSRAEGACRASSEYLLCGLPVISANSIGGRDVWYDDYNSITVDCRPENKDAQIQIKYAYEKIMKEKKDPHIIRENHLTKMKIFENNLIDHIQSIFDENNVNKKARDWYYQDLMNNKKKLSPPPSFKIKNIIEQLKN